MNALQQTINQLQAKWNALSAIRRLAIMALGLIAAVGIGGYGYLSLPGEYKPLFANLPPEDIATITGKLQSQSIPYKLDAMGTGVMVPEERLAQARVSLASEGVGSRGGKGFELFDDSSLG